MCFPIEFCERAASTAATRYAARAACASRTESRRTACTHSATCSRATPPCRQRGESAMCFSSVVHAHHLARPNDRCRALQCRRRASAGRACPSYRCARFESKDLLALGYWRIVASWGPHQCWGIECIERTAFISTGPAATMQAATRTTTRAETTKVVTRLLRIASSSNDKKRLPIATRIVAHR